MKYERKHILGVAVLVLIICLIIANVSQFAFLNKTIKSFERIAENALYWNATIKDKVVLTAKEQFLKHSTQYYKIMGWHSPKPASPKARLELRQKGGMTAWQKTQVSIKAHRYEKLIGLPKYTFVSIGYMESCFKPMCKHGGDEEGWLGIARAAVGQSYIYYQEMKDENSGLADTLRFYYKGDSSLHDPVNALKMAAVRVWGLNRLYGGNLKWIISTYHWGLGRMWPLWKGRVTFKDKWIFFPKGTDLTKATIKDASSIRNPLQYYFMWSEIQQAWAAGKKDINKELVDYMRKYMVASSEEKREWIHSWRYVHRLKRVLTQIISQKQALDKRLLKANKIVQDTEAEYYKIYKGKKTPWKKSRSIFRRLKDKFKRLRKVK